MIGYRDEGDVLKFERLIAEQPSAFDAPEQSAFSGSSTDYLYQCRIREVRARPTHQPTHRPTHQSQAQQPARKWEGSPRTRPTFPFSLKTPLHAPLAWPSKPVLSACTRYHWSNAKRLVCHRILACCDHTTAVPQSCCDQNRGCTPSFFPFSGNLNSPLTDTLAKLEWRSNFNTSAAVPVRITGLGFLLSQWLISSKHWIFKVISERDSFTWIP